MRVLALGGAGAVAKESTRDLAEFSDFDEIVIAEYNVKAAEQLAAEIGDPRLKVMHFDASDYDNLLHTFPQFDIVMNGLPFKYDYPVNKACVETGVPGCDLSSEDPQFALHEEAVRKDITFVPGCGATPGITNMMVRRATELLDQVETADIYFAAFRCLAPAPGLLTTTMWEFDPHIEERPETYYQDGAWQPTTPMSGGKLVRFHDQIGEQMVYFVPHDESYTLPQSIPGIKRASVRGCFPPHVMELMGALMRAGLLSNTAVQVGGQEMTAFDASRDLLWSVPSSRENPVWAYGLVVEVSGIRDGRHVVCTYRNEHPPQEEWGGESAYFKNVGIPLSIAAQMIAKGQVQQKGVVPPELAFSSQPFFRELAKRRIQIHEEIVETGVL
jgi:lysine 6-dehydrogenase